VHQKNAEYTVTLKLKNTGKCAGAEVAQLYIHKDQSKISRPDQELKGFSKIFLQPDESRVIQFKIAREAFQYFEEQSKKWVVEPGKYHIRIGGSSDKINCSTTVNL